MKTKSTPKTVKPTNKAKATHAQRERTKHMALGFGVIAALGSAAAYAASTLYDTVSEVV